MELLHGLADTSRIVCRFAVFETVYLQDLSKLPENLRSGLAASVKAVYLAVLGYLVEVIIFFKRPASGESSRYPAAHK